MPPIITIIVCLLSLACGGYALYAAAGFWRNGAHYAAGFLAFFAALVGLLATVVLMSGSACAAETAAGSSGHAITLPPDLMAELIDYAFLGLSAGAAWLIKRAAAWLHVSRESALVDRLEAGMQAALMFAREQALAKGQDLQTVDARSALVATAANYLAPKMPGLLKELKIDPDGLRERLTGRVDFVAPLNAADTVPGVVSTLGRALAG